MISINDLRITILALWGLALIAPAAAGRSFFIDTKAFTAEKIEATQKELEGLMVQECTSSGFTITFRKESMISQGILSRNLTLISPECPASENKTHYILSSDFRSCQTQVLMSDFNDPSILEGLANVTNQVVVYPPSLFTAGSSPDDEDSLASQYIPAFIPILCQYRVSRVNSGTGSPTTDLPSTTARPDVSPPLFKLVSTPEPTFTADDVVIEFFTTENFGTRIEEGNTSIRKGTMLYVQITPTQDGIDNVLIRDCYVESLDDWSRDYVNRHKLIQDGCQVDEKTTIISSPLTPLTPLNSKFKFRMPGRSHRQLTYLTCTVQSCRDTSTDSPHMCVSQAEFCSLTDKRTDSKFEATVRSATGFIVTKRNRDRVPPPEVTQTTITPMCPKIQSVVCDCSHIFDSIVTQATRGQQYSQSPSPSVSIEVTIGIAAGSFLLGALFTLALWCIHRRTDPMRNRNRTTHISESDGDSQNSTTPIRLISTRNEFSQPSVTS